MSGYAGKIVLSTKLDTSGLKNADRSIKSALASSTKAVAAFGAAVATAIGAVIKKSNDAYADFEQLTGGVETLFKTSADKVKKYAAEAYRTAGISGNAYMETVTSFSASLISSLKGDTEKAADVSNMALIDMSDNANKMGSSFESIQAAYQGFAKQNYTLLDNLKLGYGGTKTEMARLLKDAEAFSGVKYDINNLADVYEAIHQIQTKLDITGTTAKEAATTIKGSENMMKASWKNVLAAISGGGDLDRAIDDFVVSLATYFDNIEPAVERALMGVGQLIERIAPKLVASVSAALIRAIPSLLAAVQKMILGLAQGIVQGIKALLSGTTAQVFEQQADSIAKSTENQKGLKKAVEETNDAAKKSLSGFDEINTLSAEENAESPSVPETISNQAATIPVNINVEGNLVPQMEDLRGTLEAISVLVAVTGAGILAWKILDAYTAGASLAGVLTKVKGVMKDIGAKALIVAGAVLLIKGYCDAWVNGLDWKNLLLVLGGIAAILTGVGMKFGTFGVAIAAVAAGIALIVLGVKDFIKNGPSWENTILIIGGAIAVAVGLATAGLSVVVAAIVAAVAAVAAFTAAILLEEPAIMSTKEAQEQLTAAKEAAAEAENGYINAVDAAESALTRLQDAEAKAGISGAELYAQVQSGTLDYANMTAEQKEVYKAYLDNEEKQKALAESTAALNAAKKAETLASLENEIALGKEAGSYDQCKESILAAYNEGAISAEECRDLLAKSMSEMSDDAQKTFMEDIPSDIQSGLDPNKYETTRKKMGDWFKNAGKFFIEKIWQPIKEFWNQHIAPIFTKKFWTDLAKKAGNGLIAGFEGAINGIISMFESMINWVVKGLNKIGFDVPDWVPGIGGKKFGFNIPEVKFNRVSIPRLAQGAVIPPNREFLAVLGDQKSGTNIEAPLETIKQAVAEVLATQGSGDTVIKFTGDLAQLARVLKPVIEKEDRRVGGKIVRKAGT